MRRLMLLRHAKSDWSEAGAQDIDRKLNKRGRAAAPLIGNYMARDALVPDRVLVSSATRTRETFDLVAACFKAPPPVRFEESLYGAEAETILKFVRDTPPKVHLLLVIGHNPGLHQAALALVASGDIDPRERLREKFPTAGLAVIDIPFDDWNKVHPRAGRLDRFITPALLSADTD